MTFASWVNSFVSVASNIIAPLILAFAFLAFIWGIVNYFFLNGGNEEKRAEGRQFAIWGLLGIVVIISLWGLVDIILSTLGIAPPAS